MIAADALGWLVQDKLDKGLIKGIPVDGFNSDLCLEQFANDTNALLLNDDKSVIEFWDCLNVFCLASGSVINHSKTGCWSSNGNIPNTVSQSGCNVILNGQVFRLLGIPMGFHCTNKQRWAWVMEKLQKKFWYWQNHSPTLSSRVFVLNHYILPSVIFFLSCWRPPANSHLK